MNKKLLSLLTLSLAVATASQAGILLYEGFDYAQGPDLATQSSGTYTNYGTPTVSVVAPMTFDTLQVSGNGSSFGTNQQLFGSAKASGVGTYASNSAYYMSGLFKYTGTIDWGNGGVASAGLSNNTGDNAEGITFGLGHGAGSDVVAYAGFGYSWNMSSGKAVSGALTAGTTYFLVAKFTPGTGTYGTVDLNVYNTAVPTSESWAYSASNTTTNDFWALGDALDNFRLAKGNTAGAADMDEIRIGTTWNDVVVAVPEPATLSLVGIALGGLLLARRRR